MAVVKSETMAIQSQNDIVLVRQAVRNYSAQIGMSIVDQTKIVTAASELARNTLVYGAGGAVLLETLDEPPRRGLRLTFEDHGPGISDLDLALKDGYSTSGGLGMGLSGSRRLCNEFAIDSEPGKGTRVTVTKWK